MSYVPIDLRRRIRALSGGCCEYCRVSQTAGTVTYHIEHIIAVSHGGQTNEHNLALSCSRCNLYKGVNIAAADPETGAPTFLYHPRNHTWDEHFWLNEAVIEPLTAEGRATVFVLRLNEPERVEYRQELWEIGEYPCLRLD